MLEYIYSSAELGSVTHQNAETVSFLSWALVMVNTNSAIQGEATFVMDVDFSGLRLAVASIAKSMSCQP